MLGNRITGREEIPSMAFPSRNLLPLSFQNDWYRMGHDSGSASFWSTSSGDRAVIGAIKKDCGFTVLFVTGMDYFSAFSAASFSLRSLISISKDFWSLT